ncbi:MAG: hypothetical protein JXQ90_03370 [Cyclobacteriaceae bacterium]
MKRVLVLALGLCVAGLASAQERQANDTLPPMGVQQQAFIYGLAMKYNDLNMAKSALYNILSYNPANVNILDSLALLYFENQEFAPAVLISQDILAINPKDMLATEIAALSFERLGVKDRAIPHYEKMYLANNNINLLYQIAFLQLDVKRFNEADNNADVIIADAKAETLKMLFPRVRQGETQEVSLKAAAYRLKAMIQEEKGNTDEAKSLYLKTLELAPGFEMAQQQLAAVK